MVRSRILVPAWKLLTYPLLSRPSSVEAAVELAFLLRSRVPERSYQRVHRVWIDSTHLGIGGLAPSAGRWSRWYVVGRLYRPNASCGGSAAGANAHCEKENVSRSYS